MAVPKPKAPVGDERPEGDKRPKVKNAPADVKIVREMLRANGYWDVAEGTKCDAALIKAIRRYQKTILKAGSVDGIVDPTGTTVTKLLPGYKKWLANFNEGIEPEIELMEVRTGGVIHHLLTKDWDRASAMMVKAMKNLLLAIEKRHEASGLMMEEQLEIATGQRGLLQKFAWNTSFRLSNPPSITLAKRAAADLAALKAAINAKSITAMNATLKKAAQSVHMHFTDVMRFRNEMIGSAKQIQSGLEWAKFGLETYIGAKFASKLVTLKIDPRAAASGSAAAVKFFSETAMAIGKFAQGVNKTAYQTARDIGYGTAMEAIFAGGAEWVGSTKFVSSAAGQIGRALGLDKIAAKLGIENKVASRFVSNSLLRKGVGEGLKMAGAEAGKALLGQWTSTPGKASQKAFEAEAINKFVAKGGAKMRAVMTAFTSKWQSEAPRHLKKAVIPTYLLMEPGARAMDRKTKDKLADKLAKDLTPAAIQAGAARAMTKGTIEDGAAKLVDMAAEALTTDKVFLQKVAKSVKDAVAKEAGGAKPKRAGAGRIN